MQILADRVEFYWTHLSGIGSLENSLWGWDGRRVRIWLDALTIERVRVDARRDVYESVKESVEIPLDFYPLGEPFSLARPLGSSHFGLLLSSAVLMDKGIVVGVDQEISLRRNLDFAIFRLVTTVGPPSPLLRPAANRSRADSMSADPSIPAPHPPLPPRPRPGPRGRCLRLAVCTPSLLPACS